MIASGHAANACSGQISGIGLDSAKRMGAPGHRGDPVWCQQARAGEADEDIRAM